MSFVESAYALVTAPGVRQRRRLRLPVTIGSSTACDVIVNSAAVAPLGYVVYSEKGVLHAFHNASSREVPLRSLKALGIELVGPIAGEAKTSGRAMPAPREFLAKEAARFDRLPSAVRTALLGSLPQKARLGVWGFAFTLGIALLTGVGQEAPPALDLADDAKELAFDAIFTQTVGASPKNPDFVKGYEKGVTFVLDMPAVDASLASLMSFDVAGLNLGHELILKINDKVVLQTEAEGACAQESCSKSLRLEQGLLKPGQNKIVFEHTRPESSYFLARIHVRSLPPMKAEETQQAARWLEIAERAYAERQIVPDNVVTAGRFAEQVLKLARERDGAKDVESRAAALKREIDVAHVAMAKALWDEFAVNERLERRPEQERVLDHLLRLYPDPAAPEHARVREKLEELKEKSR